MSPCHWSVTRSSGDPANTGSSRPSDVISTGRRPTSGSSPAYTRAPRLAASSCTPRQTPQNGVPARTASAIERFSPVSQGNVSSSYALIGPPIATIASNPRQSGRGSPSSSSTRWITAPRSTSTSSNTPGGSHAMCCRTRISMEEVSRMLNPSEFLGVRPRSRPLQGFARRRRDPRAGSALADPALAESQCPAGRYPR